MSAPNTGSLVPESAPKAVSIPRSAAGDVAIVASNSFFEQRIRRVLSGDGAPRIVQWPVSGAEPGASGVAVCFLGPDLPPESMAAMATAIDREHPEVSVVLVAHRSPEILEQALRSGVRDVIEPDATEGEIVSVLSRSLEAAARRRQLVTATQAATKKREVVTILSPKGGVGKTFLSTNLAVLLAARVPNEVVLVDLDLQFGDVTASLHLLPEHNISDAARSHMAREASMVKVFLTAHKSGLYVMCAPDDPADADEVSFDQSCDVVRQLTNSFNMVIIDTCAGLDAHALAAAEMSTHLVFISGVDVASVRALRKELDALDRLGMTYQKRHLVLNRSDSMGGARPEDVEVALGLKAAVTLPNDRSVLAAVNQGLPVVKAEPKGVLARKLAAFADTLVDTDEKTTLAPAKQSSFALLRRKPA